MDDSDYYDYYSGYLDYSSADDVYKPSYGNMSATNGTTSTFNTTVGGSSYDYHPYYYEGEEYYYYYGYYLEIVPFEIVTKGYVRPILVFITTLVNLFVCGFFLTKKHRGTSTGLLFISIAFSDTLTGLSLLPNSLAIYAVDYTEISRAWCVWYMLLRFYIFRVFHTVSVWQTIILSIQRYMSVCHPMLYNRTCTFRKTLIYIGFSYVFAAILHIYHVVDSELGTEIRCRSEVEQPCTRTCVYLWFSVALQHLIPCVLLLSLAIKTVLELKKTQRRASTMSHMPNSSTQFRKDRVITITTILIVVCFLIPELPHSIYKIALVIQQHVGEESILPPMINQIIISIYEIVLIISFNANFWIYFAMIQPFRQMLVRIVTCGRAILRQSEPRRITDPDDTPPHEQVPLREYDGLTSSM